MKKLTLTLVVTLGGSAFASADYPTVIQTKYSLAAPPPQSCALCHTNGITGTGTVNTLIGKALRTRGLVSGNATSLTTSLDTLATDMVDSDGDGVTDVAELMAGTDPNTAATTTGGGGGATGGGGGTTLAPLKYGCGASVAPDLLALAGLAWFARRRR